MTRVIAKREFAELWRDGRFRVVAVITMLLLASSEVQAKANALMRGEWVNQGDKNPHMAGHYGTFIFKPVGALSLFDRGTESYTGTQVFLEAHKQNDFNFRPAQDRTTASRFAELTAATILQLLVPLLIFLLTFSAFTSEREGGTLRQTLSLGLTRRRFALGKVAGVSFGIFAVLLPIVLLGSFALVLLGETNGNIDLMPRFGLLVVGYLVYFATCICIGLAVSAWADSTRTALLILLVVWFVSALIVPRSSTALAKAVFPTSTLQFNESVAKDFEMGIDGHASENKRNDEFKQSVLARYGVKNAKDLPINFDGMLMQADEEYRAKVLDRRFGELWANWKNQSDLQAVSGIFMPVQAVRNFSMGISDTDLGSQQSFAQAVESYRRQMVKTLNDDMTVNSKTGDWDYEAGRSLYEQIPDFSYRAMSVVESLKGQFISLLALVIWFAFALGLLYVTTGRMRIE
jgi:ABC-2 type transport system permease protein